jgi:hypothetical protein
VHLYWMWREDRDYSQSKMFGSHASLRDRFELGKGTAGTSSWKDLVEKDIPFHGVRINFDHISCHLRAGPDHFSRS